MKQKTKDYFTNHFATDWSNFDLTGYSLLSKLPTQGEETILDIGCGYNPLKTWFEHRLYGIDPCNDFADEKVSIEDFECDHQFDVILALGSINFGTMEDIYAQTQKAVTLLKPGGRMYWRQNPGIYDHKPEEFKEVDLFSWSFKINITVAEALNMEVVDLRWDNSRIYSEWRKPNVGDGSGNGG